MRKYWKASYTIEASIIVPIILLAFCAMITIGFDLHDCVKKAAADYEKLQIETMEIIRKQDIVLNMGGK